jgi:hypothetical protein
MMMCFFKRLEISFWTASIALMQNRKAMRVTALLFCCLFLLLTISVSMFVFNIIDGAASVDEFQSEVSLQNSKSSQKNFLVILADRLDQRKPNLNGAWLAVYQSSEPRLIFLPIYPNVNNGSQSNQDELAEYFQLDAEGIPTTKFFKQIEQKKIWWDHVILLDEVSLGRLVEITGGLNLGGGKLDGPEAVSQFVINQDDPHAQQFTQAIVFRGLCQETEALIQSAVFSEEFSNLSEHWYSDLDFKIITEDWSVDKGFEGLSCEMPVLREVSLSQEFNK